MDDLAHLRDDWDDLALAGGSPFTTFDWLAAVSDAAAAPVTCVLVRGPGGGLSAAAALTAVRGGLASLGTVGQTGAWDVVAADGRARRAVWAAVARLGAPRLTLVSIPTAGGEARTAADVLDACGYRVATERRPLCPYLAFPDTWEEFTAGMSRNLRSSLKRKQRQLSAEGAVTFRTNRGDGDVDADFAALLALEAGGWKGDAGTAIASGDYTSRFHRRFVAAAAARGWLRLRFLELDGRPVAADYSVQFAGCESLIKTAFDERYARTSPGLLLRAEVLRAVHAEGARGYDFLGDPDHYKMRWATGLHPRLQIHAYRGAARLPEYAYRAGVRPRLRTLYRRLRHRGEAGGRP
jgi:CelD/BcsL family acetyltransferase involved in cellulose biosynthesis